MSTSCSGNIGIVWCSKHSTEQPTAPPSRRKGKKGRKKRDKREIKETKQGARIHTLLAYYTLPHPDQSKTEQDSINPAPRPMNTRPANARLQLQPTNQYTRVVGYQFCREGCSNKTSVGSRDKGVAGDGLGCIACVALRL